MMESKVKAACDRIEKQLKQNMNAVGGTDMELSGFAYQSSTTFKIGPCKLCGVTLKELRDRGESRDIICHIFEGNFTCPECQNRKG